MSPLPMLSTSAVRSSTASMSLKSSLSASGTLKRCQVAIEPAPPNRDELTTDRVFRILLPDGITKEVRYEGKRVQVPLQ